VAVRGGHVPEGPDPNDRAASKRTWEKAMKEWRVELKRLVAAAAPPGLLTNHGFASDALVKSCSANTLRQGPLLVWHVGRRASAYVPRRSSAH
jgi:hypothetical protein